MLAVALAHDDVGVARQARQGLQNFHRRAVERDRLLARLAVGEEQAAPAEVDVIPLERQDLVHPRAGQQKQPDRGGHEQIDGVVGFAFGQGPAKRFQLCL